MKNILLCGALVAMLSLFGCGNAPAHRPLAEIRRSQTLNVAVCSDGEPHAYVAGGRFMGNEVEFITDFAHSMGVEPVFSAVRREGLADALRSGAADVGIGRVTAVLAGSFSATLSSPVTIEQVYALSLRGSPYLTASVAAGCKAGYLGADIPEALSAVSGSFGDFRAVDNHDAAAELLREKILDTVFCFSQDADRIIAALGEQIECNDLADISPVLYGSAVSRGNSELLHELNAYILSVQTEEKAHEVDE